jgi:hypothetical protein
MHAWTLQYMPSGQVSPPPQNSTHAVLSAMIPSMHSTVAVPVAGGAKQSQRSWQPAIVHAPPPGLWNAAMHVKLPTEAPVPM